MSTYLLMTMLDEPISTSGVNERAVNIKFGTTENSISVTVPYERIPELFLKITECLPPQETEPVTSHRHCIVTEEDVTDEEVQERLQKNGQRYERANDPGVGVLRNNHRAPGGAGNLDEGDDAMNKDERWQELARQEQEAMKLWGMIAAITVIAIVIAALVVIQ